MMSCVLNGSSLTARRGSCAADPNAGLTLRTRRADSRGWLYKAASVGLVLADDPDRSDALEEVRLMCPNARC